MDTRGLAVSATMLTASVAKMRKAHGDLSMVISTLQYECLSLVRRRRSVAPIDKSNKSLLLFRWKKQIDWEAPWSRRIEPVNCHRAS
jgi:hypothetical protein